MCRVFFNLYQENWYSDGISILGFKMVFSDNSNEIMVKKAGFYYFGQAVKMHNIDFYTKLALNCPPERAVHSKVVNKMTHSIYHYKNS